MDGQREVLVIDEDEDSREALCVVLEGSGFKPNGAKTAGGALRRLRAGLLPCAILLNLTRTDALPFRAAQLANAHWARIPVVVGTGIGRTPSILQDPGADYVLRPFDLDRLVALMGLICSVRDPGLGRALA